MIGRRYGDSPLHALGHLVSLAVAGWAILQLVDARSPLGILTWAIGAVLLHDFLLLPFYSVLDRAATRTRRPRRAVNFVRVPAGLSLLLLLVFFPVILGLQKAESAYAARAADVYDGYLERWLLASALLFAGSGLLYLLRTRRASPDQRSSGSTS